MYTIVLPYLLVLTKNNVSILFTQLKDVYNDLRLNHEYHIFRHVAMCTWKNELGLGDVFVSFVLVIC